MPDLPITFTQETAPKVERTKKPNPYTDTVKAIAALPKGESFAFDLAEGQNLSGIRGALDRAGAELTPPVSIHIRTSPKGATSGPAHVNVWATPKIKQNRAGAATDAK